MFPYTYNNDTYNRCISTNSEQNWCSTTANYDLDKQWGYCQACHQTHGGNSHEACCQLPFVYQGMIYRNCIKDSNGRPWCATTYNYDQDNQWGLCKEITPKLNARVQAKCPPTCATKCISSCPDHCCTSQPTSQSSLAPTPMPPPPPPPPPVYIQPQAPIYAPPPPMQYAPVQPPQPYYYNYNAQCPAGCHFYCAGHCPVYCCPQRQQNYYTNLMTRANFPTTYKYQQRNYARSSIGQQCPVYCTRNCLAGCPVKCCTKLNILKYLAKKHSEKMNVIKRAKSFNMLQPPPMSLSPFTSRERSSSTGACPITCAARCTKACTRQCCASRPSGVTTNNNGKRDKIGTTNVHDIDVRDCHGGIPTFGGNGNGACCSFPFIYHGKVYNECTSKDSKEKWCSTTPIYDVDQQWGLCLW